MSQLEIHIAELEAKANAKPRSLPASPGFHSPASIAPIGEGATVNPKSPDTTRAAGLVIEPAKPEPVQMLKPLKEPELCPYGSGNGLNIVDRREPQVPTPRGHEGNPRYNANPKPSPGKSPESGG